LSGDFRKVGRVILSKSGHGLVFFIDGLEHALTIKTFLMQRVIDERSKFEYISEIPIPIKEKEKNEAD